MTDTITTPEPLPVTTTERLRKVASIIRIGYETWNQSSWVNGFAWGSGTPTEEYMEFQAERPFDFFGEVDVQQGRNNHTCGTRCCTAGWAVRYTPVEIQLPGDWVGAGAVALGLTDHLAGCMFSGSFGSGVDNAPDKVAHLLERLADVPESERTLNSVRAWMAEGDEIVTELFDGWGLL